MYFLLIKEKTWLTASANMICFYAYVLFAQSI